MERKELKMGTNIRPAVSSKNKYWIDREKYYELKHFCRQYPAWKKAYSAFTTGKLTPSYSEKVQISNFEMPTEEFATLLYELSHKIQLVDVCATEADPELAKYLRLSVTEGFSFDYLKTTLDMPCGRDTFYDRYRKFFWLLSKRR